MLIFITQEIIPSLQHIFLKLLVFRIQFYRYQLKFFINAYIIHELPINQVMKLLL
jgi:hypothetical protein